MPWRPSVEDEFRLVNTNRQRWDTIESRAKGWDPTSIARLTNIENVYPWLEPDIAAPMARAGEDIDSPSLLALARNKGLEMTQSKTFPQLFKEDAPAQKFMNHNPSAKPPSEMLDLSALSSMSAGDMRIGALTPGDMEQRALRQELAISDAEASRALMGRAPVAMLEGDDLESEILETEKLQNQVLREMMIAGDSAQGLAMQEQFTSMRSHLDQLYAKRSENSTGRYKSTSGWNPFGMAADAVHYGMEGLKATTRYGTAVLDAPYQMVQGTIRNLYDAALYSDPGDPREMIESLVASASSPIGLLPGLEGVTPDWLEEEWEQDIWGQSDLGVMIDDIWSGDFNIFNDDYTGGGWFIDQTSDVAEARRANESAMATIDGRVVTFGRLLTSKMLPIDHNSTAYSVVSGALDGALAVAGAQEAAVAKGASALTKLTKTTRLSGTGGDIVAALSKNRKAEWGAYRGMREFTNLDEFHAFRGTDEYRNLLDYIVKQRGNDERFAHLMGLMGNEMDPRILKRALDRVDGLADEAGNIENIDEARHIVDLTFTEDVTQLGGQLPRLTDPTIQYRNRNMSRAGNFMNQRSFNADDPLEAYRETERLIRNLIPANKLDQDGMVPSEMWKYLEEMAGAETRQARYKILYGARGAEDGERARGLMDEIADHLVEKGWDQSIAHRVTRAYDNNRLLATRTYDGDIAYAKEKKQLRIGGEDLPMDPVRILSESIGDTIYLPDARELGKLTGDVRASRAMRAFTLDQATAGRKAKQRLEGTIANAKEELQKAEDVLGKTQLPEKRLEIQAEIRALKADIREMDDELAAAAKQGRGVKLGSAYLGHTALTGTTFLSERLWKTTRLLRVAWPLRVVAEEQLRMAGSGLNSAFKSPVSYLAWAFTNRGNKDLMGNELLTLGKRADDLAPDAQRTAQQALNRADWRRGDWTSHKLRSNEYVVLNKHGEDIEEFALGWGDELKKLSVEPAANRIARGESVDDVVEWMMTTPGGRKYLMEVSNSNPRAVAMTSERQVREFVENVSDRVQYATGNAPELAEVVAHGRLRGRNIVDNAGRNSGEFDSLLRDQDWLDVYAPDEVVGNVRISEAAEHPIRNTVDFFMGALGSAPTNKLSRNPTFKQLYWNDITDRVAYGVTPDVAAQISRQARAAGLSTDQVKKIQDAMVVDSAAKIDDIAVLDEVSKYAALTDSNDLLMNMAERRAHWDALRLVFPFGDAWEEVVRAWLSPVNGLISQNPIILRRANQALGALRSPDVGQLFGENRDPITGEERGFVWTDPGTGEEIFAYPFANDIMAMTGMPTGFTGNLAGLNMIGDVYPGLGPAVTLPLQALTRDNPSFNKFEHIVFPYGETESIWQQAIPTWAGKMMTAFAGDPTDPGMGWWEKALTEVINVMGFDGQVQKQYQYAQMDALRWLVSKGEADLSTPEGITSALTRSREIARNTYFMRGVAQLVSPAAPMPQAPVMIQDPITGENVPVPFSDLMEVFAVYKETDPTDGAYRFLEDYGATTLSLMKGKSYQTSWGAITSKEQSDWMAGAQGQQITNRYPNTGYLFAPQGGDFELDVFSRWFEDTRRPMEPREWAHASQDMVADTIYWHWKERLQNQQNGTEMLAVISQELQEQYPTWRSSLVTTGKARPEDAIAELEQAVSDPLTRNTAGGQLLASYFEARGEAAVRLQARGRDIGSSAEDVRDINRRLYQIGENMAQRHPQFRPMWNLLRREFSSDITVI